MGRIRRGKAHLLRACSSHYVDASAAPDLPGLATSSTDLAQVGQATTSGPSLKWENVSNFLAEITSFTGFPEIDILNVSTNPSMISVLKAIDDFINEL